MVSAVMLLRSTSAVGRTAGLTTGVTAPIRAVRSSQARVDFPDVGNGIMSASGRESVVPFAQVGS